MLKRIVRVTRMMLKTVLEYQSPRKLYVQCRLFRFIVRWTSML